MSWAPEVNLHGEHSKFYLSVLQWKLAGRDYLTVKVSSEGTRIIVQQFLFLSI